MTIVTWKIPLFKIYWDENDVEAVSNVIRRGTYWANGKEIPEFEEEIAKYVGTKYAVAFNSGTSALHALFLAYDIQSSEVIVPSFTFIATANSVLMANGKVVFAEVETDSFGLDANDVNEKITKKTKAIMPVHIAGQPCKDIKELTDIAQDKNLLLLEDAAQTLGSYSKYGKAGTFGDAAMFSFCQNKVITTGEGGLLVLDDEKIYEKLKLIRSHGRLESSNSDYFSNINDNEYIQIGFNFRMSSMTAALGLSQYRKISKVLEIRKQKAAYLNEHLVKLDGLTVPKAFNDANHIYQLYILKFTESDLRDKVQEHLQDKGVMSKVYFNPIHLKEFYRKTFSYKEGDLPVTEDLSTKVLSLPMFNDLTTDEMDYMIDSIKEVL